MSNATDTTHSNPFPGLRPFHEDEVHLFFGRESQVDAMVDKLAATRFLAVVGISGSGKSSLVNCGLRPALFGGLLARAGSAWRVGQFRPGSNPLAEMARTLAQDGVLFSDDESDGGLSLTDIVDTTLHMSKRGLVDIVEQARLPKGTNLLLVVDQFEELFRFRQLVDDGDGKDKDKHATISEQATAFVNLLLEAAAQTTIPIYVVLTMRSDFFGDCAQFSGLAEAINGGQYLVPRITRDERRSAISGPVSVGGVQISPLLLTRLINDVGDNPDQLSILQHALNRTWAYWENESSGDGPLALTHYEAVGSMAHALDQHAEKAYSELRTRRQQQICEKIFKALTDKATDPRGIRRPTPMSTLCALTEATAVEVTEVIDIFRKPSRSFLMPPASEALLEGTIIDISHESLMRVWQRLNTWADEEAQSARMYRRLVDTTKLFVEGKANLLHDAELLLALDWREKEKPTAAWAGRYQGRFSATMGFLQRSKFARDGAAPTWRRILSMLIDAVVMTFICVFFGFIVPLGIHFIGLDFDPAIFETEMAKRSFKENNIYMLSMLVLGTTILLYDALMTSSSRQGTLGKMALRIRVTDAKGERVSFGRASLRFLAKPFLWPYIVTIPFSVKKQAPYDMISGCQVWTSPGELETSNQGAQKQELREPDANRKPEPSFQDI